MKLKCPACGSELKKMKVSGIELDVCDGGCGGVFFNNHELKKLDEPHEAAGTELLDLKRNPATSIQHGPRNCPACQNIVMLKQFFSVKRKIEVDLCGNCAGYFLDAGELASIRAEFKTEAERVGAFHDMFEEVFGAELQMQKQESLKKAESARKIARMFRFICPSAYIPGKQKGGAW